MAVANTTVDVSPGSGYGIPASTFVEKVASTNSTSVFVYDLAEHVNFGAQTKEWGQANRGGHNVVSLQTRAGAGLSLIGRLSEAGMSTETQKDSVLTAYNTPTGLAIMIPSFAHLPEPTSTRRLVVQVPTITPVGPTLELSPTLAPLAPVLNSLSDSFVVLLSSSPQEIVDLAKAAYGITSAHVIHLFDHYGAGREVGNIILNSAAVSHSASVHDALRRAGYGLFDYVGDPRASEVLVVLNGPLASAAKVFAKNASGFGVIIVRVLRPWDDKHFLSSLPETVKTVHVMDEVPTEGTQGILYMYVFATCLGSRSIKPAVRAARVVPAHTQEYIKSPSAFAVFLGEFTRAGVPLSLPLQTSGKKNLIFLGTTASSVAPLPEHIINTFIANESVRTRALINYDVFSKPGGISATRILLVRDVGLEEYVPFHVSLPLGFESGAKDGRADFLAILDQGLLKSHSVVEHLQPNATLLLFSSWSSSEVLSNLPSDVLSLIREMKMRVYLIDAKAVAADVPSPSVQSIIGHLVFLRLYLGPTASEVTLRRLAHLIYGENEGHLNIDKLSAKTWAALEEFNTSQSKESPTDEAPVELKSFEFNAVTCDLSDGQMSLPGAHLSSWHDAARHILFPDAFIPSDIPPYSEEYPQNPALRPELPERTFLVTCSVNRRLTPLDYDRNVFHIEFDTSGTGLKYAIGEALGVHGWNDADDVLDFCSWYGADPDRLITIQVPGGEGCVHTRTVFQGLQQQVDLFGKPPKSFYADLADHATRKEDKLSLQFIGSPEGSATFKKLSEKDTVTFADVLRKYKTARPSIELLCEMVGDIKPRHYSIASAQSVVGDRVDLLVVTVEWANPSGSPRYGQCTRYLAELKVGQKVTVSIKPSVMKLPPNNMQPLILAGLGTGAAPFRAFLQHRALLASRGEAVGPLYYYFGSRHRSKEYLYGEEIEAFMLDQTITKAGLAFSRDGRRKVYIQHKMIEDAEQLVRMLHTDKGVFYLCGPTWPVPDVYETLVGALVKHIGLGATEAGEYLEGLKEEERYVLEVY